MNGGPGRTKAPQRARTRPEWVTFGAATVVLLLVVGALVSLALRTDGPAAPVAGPPGPASQIDGRYFVTVEVVNGGDAAAAEVQVTAELVTGGAMVSGEQVIDILGGGETQSLTFVFADDPADGELSIDVTSFAEP